MPFSDPEGKHLTYALLKRLHASLAFGEILDVGAGAAFYSRLLRKRLPGSRWTGLEVWEPYRERFSLDQHYDRVLIADIRDWQPDRNYDLVLLGDILEHMRKDEAQAVVLKLLHHCQLLLISIPIVPMPQEASEGNPYERHVKDDWSHEEVLSSFSNISFAFVGERLGVYLLSSNQGVNEVVQLLIADLPSDFA